LIFSHHLTKWSDKIKYTNQIEKYELLKNHLTNAKMRQKVFYAWKLTVQDSLAQKDLEKFYEWKNICEVNRDMKFINRSTILVNLCSSEHQKYLVLKTFNALKSKSV
jgi:hypothetical protein